MTNPCPGYKVTTAFGVPGSWSAGYHTGDDYAAPVGAKVVATRSGKVIKTGFAGDYGNQVIIQTSHIRHSYNHLSVISVSVGQQVKENQLIGKVGNTGRSTGPHLHYEERDEAPYGYNNHRRPAFNKEYPSSTTNWKHAPGSKVFGRYTKFDGHEQNSDRHSLSIEMIQEMLNNHSMPGGSSLPITGKYWTGTDAEVRLCQRLHGKEFGQSNPDSINKSSVGPKQFEHLKKATGAPYVYVDDRNNSSNVGSGSSSGSTDSSDASIAWFVPASLIALRDEVDAKWPNRDKRSDGTIGDYLHSQSQSEHNPVGHKFGPKYGTVGAVHAIDITANGIDTDILLKAVIGDHRVWYCIYDGYIWSKNHGPWTPRVYTGSDPHKTHVHISLRADSPAEALRSEKDIDVWMKTEPPEIEPDQPPPLPPWLEEFIRSNWAPILIIGTAMVLVLVILLT